MTALMMLGTLWGAWTWRHPDPRRRPLLAHERWYNANHLRVQVRGQWQDVMLMPLADHLCRSGQPLFERYCNEPQGAKSP